ncbi:thiamine phosphate synthase [Joostella atrarenae]|uniref:Thiamine phosphate synthase n=1 Tax=Joostella atrarenae TaxID=679257 RepID=A0ABS9IZ93_9FLAO|nr:thiamine phosphate synthase [Joostella atrarenae]MCF8713493.1 thiamine phosphate synthase [Joostella atrarenae]
MLILITNEENNREEWKIWKMLFDSGLERLHIRKPSIKKEELNLLLENLEECYHQKIMLHGHHELISEFNLKGIHFTENYRKEHENVQKCIKNHQNNGKLVSTGFHSIVAIEEGYDYTFLSPVFNSISKENYQGKGFDASSLKKNIIALGGVHATNIESAYNLGYSGVAVLGSVWNAKDPLESFKSINQKYKKVYGESSLYN